MVTKGIPWDDLPTQKARGVAVARPEVAASSVTGNSVSGPGIDTVPAQHDSTMPISERNFVQDGATYFRIYSSY